MSQLRVLDIDDNNAALVKVGNPDDIPSSPNGEPDGDLPALYLQTTRNVPKFAEILWHYGYYEEEVMMPPLSIDYVNVPTEIKKNPLEASDSTPIAGVQQRMRRAIENIEQRILHGTPDLTCFDPNASLPTDGSFVSQDSSQAEEFVSPPSLKFPFSDP